MRLALAIGRIGAVCATLLLSGCQVQWVSPYSADLQKKASDMLSDVVAWEVQMRSAAGTAAADPRNPDVKAKFAAWAGNIEAMAQIELGIDPGASGCDAVLAQLSGIVSPALKKILPSTAAAGSSDRRTLSHCDTLPNIFTTMTKQVSGSTADNAGMPFIMDQQCKVPWLTDDYFTSLHEAKSTGAVVAPPRTPTTTERRDAVTRCRALFEAPPGAAHGPLVTPLVTDLDAIIYREGRQAPPASK